MSDADGYKVETSVGRYLPYGRWRTEPTADLTDRAYTGQKENMDIGLYYYNARYYVPGAGRLISADTLVPDPTNPQQFNRYTYVLNNPLRYTDPTGHCISSYDPNEQYDELQYCVGAVLDLNKYFYDTYGKDWADSMLPYIRWLLENAPIEQVLLDLAAWGIDPPPNNPLAPQSGSSLQGCIPNGGFHKCPPEGGWPAYKPLTEEDRVLLARLTKWPLSFLTSFGWGRVITSRVGSFLVNTIVSQTITYPAIDCAYGTPDFQPISIPYNPALSTDMSAFQVESKLHGNTSNLAPIPLGFYPQPKDFYHTSSNKNNGWSWP
jgi:RHS repeat-associated protein